MVVVEVKSADSAKVETEINKIKIDKELVEKKYKLEKEIENFTQKLANWISKRISTKISLGENYCYEEIYYSNWQHTEAPDFDRCMKMLCQVFQGAGYKASFDYYSRSWQSQSGKVCKLYIDW